MNKLEAPPRGETMKRIECRIMERFHVDRRAARKLLNEALAYNSTLDAVFCAICRMRGEVIDTPMTVSIKED